MLVIYAPSLPFEWNKGLGEIYEKYCSLEILAVILSMDTHDLGNGGSIYIRVKITHSIHK